MKAIKVNSIYPDHMQKWEVYRNEEYVGYALTSMASTEKDAIQEYFISRQSDF